MNMSASEVDHPKAQNKTIQLISLHSLNTDKSVKRLWKMQMFLPPLSRVANHCIFLWTSHISVSVSHMPAWAFPECKMSHIYVLVHFSLPFGYQ